MKDYLILLFALFVITSLFSDPVAPIGQGTENDPYQIASLDNLEWLNDFHHVWNSGAHYIQTADIDASNTESWNYGLGYYRIGVGNNKFSGVMTDRVTVLLDYP